MNILLDAGVLGPLRRTPGRTALAVIAIALGVALGIAIYLLNRVAAQEVSRAARSLFGVADLAIESTGHGFDEMLYPLLARAPGVLAVSPSVEVEAKLRDHRGTLTVLGLDVFRARELQPTLAQLAGPGAGPGFRILDPGMVFLSAQAARDLNLQSGDELRLQVGLAPLHFTVAGVLPPASFAERAAVIDIGTAQARFDWIGRLSRINVRLAPGADPDQVRMQLQSLLGTQARIVTPGEAGDEAVRLSRAYRANLLALALVALFTGGFFVYSTQALATSRRRGEFALLHALGVTRRQQWLLVMSSGALLGLIGAALGVLAGIAVARFGVTALGADLGAGYFRDTSVPLRLHWQEVVTFCVLGMAVAVIGSLRPAIAAARTPTAVALKAGDVLSSDVHTYPGLVIALLIFAVALLFAPPIAGLPLSGYLAIVLLLFATLAAMPGLLRLMLRVLSGFGSPVWQVALAQLRGTARYATLSVAAIVVSFSLMVAMAIMVTSFRSSLDVWTQKVLPADIYVRAGYAQQTAYFDADTVASLRQLQGVARLEASRFATALIDPQRPTLTLIARPLRDAQVEQQLWLRRQADGPAPSDVIAAWLSESAADLYGIDVGTTLAVTLNGVPTRVSVRGLWRDYEHPNGAMVIDREDYQRLTGDAAVNTLWLWLEQGESSAAMRERIQQQLPADATYDVRTPQELRRMTLQVFDRTFAVTYVLELIAICIGLFGISAGMSAQVLARRGEFGALRYLGFTRAQVAALLAVEGGVLGILGVLTGLIAGAAIGWILIYVVNRQSFHWSMDMFVPGALLTALSVTLVICAAGIAVVSGRQAMSGEAVRAVKEDW